ncbi:hypothetical protein PO124_32040 [Bacillus licheniformis]|nr:hypothetical protein [Bacillus licheniformis]
MDIYTPQSNEGENIPFSSTFTAEDGQAATKQGCFEAGIFTDNGYVLYLSTIGFIPMFSMMKWLMMRPRP